MRRKANRKSQKLSPLKKLADNIANVFIHLRYNHTLAINVSITKTGPYSNFFQINSVK